jgi:DNA-binding beta-propeller fold protein YncE
MPALLWLCPVDPAKTGLVRVYVADRAAKCVLVFKAAGTFERYIGSGHLEAPYGVACHPENGAVFVSDNATNVVKVFAQDGRLLRKMGHGATCVSYFFCVTDLGCLRFGVVCFA